MQPTLRTFSLYGVALALSVATATAQGSRNVSLQSQFRPNDTFNDIWGYLDPNTGGEYAVLMSRNGTYIVNCTDPTNPQQTGYLSRSLSSWSRSTWRDGRTFGQYLYVVTEGGGGMQIINLANPNSPQFVRTYRPGGVDWSNSHNISVDLDTGICYVVGTSGGMHIIDLNANPANPTYLGSYTSQYVHDMQAQNGYGHLAEINRDIYRIVDVTSLPSTPSLDSIGKNASHQVWPTRDDNWSAVCSETFGGDVDFYDIRNKTNIRRVSSYQAGGSRTSVHNGFILGRQAHFSYYSEGYRGVDISDPNTPVEVGFYDTSTATSGFDGAWGCYPFQPSGNVYISDFDSGLIVLKPTSTFVHYGDATPGTGGVAPELYGFGAAFLGNSNFALEVEEANPNSLAIFLLGTTRANIAVGGLTVLVDTVSSVGAAITTTTDANGKGVLQVPVPNDIRLNGLVLNAQALVADPNGSLGYAATDGQTFEVFQR